MINIYIKVASNNRQQQRQSLRKCRRIKSPIRNSYSGAEPVFHPSLVSRVLCFAANKASKKCLLFFSNDRELTRHDTRDVGRLAGKRCKLDSFRIPHPDWWWWWWRWTELSAARHEEIIQLPRIFWGPRPLHYLHLHSPQIYYRRRNHIFLTACCWATSKRLPTKAMSHGDILRRRRP